MKPSTVTDAAPEWKRDVVPGGSPLPRAEADPSVSAAAPGQEQSAARPSWNRRWLEPEWMDQPQLDAVQHRDALAGLRRINFVSRTHVPLLTALQPLITTDPQRPWKMLDIACGSGDVTRRLERAARRRGWNLQVDGCDVSPLAVADARQAARDAARTGSPTQATQGEFFEFDITQSDWPTGYDVLCSTLFLHHLSDDAARALLRNMRRAARCQVIVSDLIRGRMGYLAAWFATQTLSWSPIVYHDGLASVRAAFRPAELARLAEEADLKHATIHRCWPWRMILSWTRPDVASTKVAL